MTTPTEAALREALEEINKAAANLILLTRTSRGSDEYDEAACRKLENLLAQALSLVPQGVEPGVVEQLLPRFSENAKEVLSPIILVHQLRASAQIQDVATKRETGWATTSDRAGLMRRAADAIEALAALSADPGACGAPSAPSLAEGRWVSHEHHEVLCRNAARCRWPDCRCLPIPATQAGSGA